MGNEQSVSEQHHTNVPTTTPQYGGGRGSPGSTSLGTDFMRPSELRYTHNSVSNKFSNGIPMEDTFRLFMLEKLQIHPDEIPPMVVMQAPQYPGPWFVVRGNRRLYLMKKAEECNRLRKVKVKKQEYDEALFNKQFSSTDVGKSIRIRGDPDMSQKLDVIVQEWKEWKRSQGVRMVHTGGNDWYIV